MTLIIYFGDFETLISTSKWFKHSSVEENYLSFSDSVFPWFFFAIGLFNISMEVLAISIFQLPD